MGVEGNCTTKNRNSKGQFVKGHSVTFDGWKGKTFSAEHRQKLSESHKGKPSNRKGKKDSFETIEKKRLSHLGHVVPLEQRQRQSETIKQKLKENPRPPECYIKFYKAGQKANTGKHLIEEHKRKIGLGNKGKFVSEETCLKMSISSKAGMTKERIRKILTRRIPSSLEIQFQEIIDKHKLPYEFVGNGSFIIGGYNPDFINTNNEKIAIEVYAQYFKKKKHSTIKGWKIGRQNTFRKYGWKILFFDESQVNEKNVLKKVGMFNE